MLMLFNAPLGFITSYIDNLNNSLEKYKPGSGLSTIQRTWLSFCITAILVTNSVCWAKFERASFGKYSLSALSWMFRNSKISWDILLHMSIRVILGSYGITEGILVIDDSDKKRSKKTTRIAHVHKIKDKTSGGYVMGQNIVFLLLVTPIITIPVGFYFYTPDPALREWENNDKRLKKQGVSKKDRPLKPQRNPDHPKKQEIGISLLKEFKKFHANIKVKLILADALYCSAFFMDTASQVFDKIQVISQLKSNISISPCMSSKPSSFFDYQIIE